MKRFLIRFDDLNPYMSETVLHEIKNICRKYRNSVLLCVVPFCSDESLKINKDLGEIFWEIMRYCQNKKAVIGLHGCTHSLYKNSNKQIFPISNKTEFSGLKISEQYEKLKKGKMFLESHGLDVRFFAAPAHSMDTNTIKVLKDININIVSDSFFSTTTNWMGLTWIPLKNWRESTYFFGSLSTLCKHPKELNGKYKFNLNLKRNSKLTNFDQEILKPLKYDFNQKILHNFYSIIFRIIRFKKILNLYCQKLFKYIFGFNKRN